MKILFLGDVVGRAGRNEITEKLPIICDQFAPDFVIVNGENASGGMGLSSKHAEEILGAGADVVTLGDHAYDQKDIIPLFEREPRVIRPMNYAKNAPGRGHGIFKTKSGEKILVAQALGQVFMRQPFSDPFGALDDLLKTYKLGQNIDAAFVDFHAEVTSEKTAMGIWLDGRVSAVVGTHTHIPTGDTMIFPAGTAYQTDAGMCGCYHSVIGMDAEEPLRRFITGMNKGRFTPAMGEVTLSGTWVETGKNGKATRAIPFKMGGHLAPSLP